MKYKKISLILGLLSIFFIGIAVYLAIQQYQLSRNQECIFPKDLVLANVPVEGLTPEQAEDRLQQIYKIPVQVEIAGEIIEFSPDELGFVIQADKMVDEAAIACNQAETLASFWHYLWEKENKKTFNEVSLIADVDHQRIEKSIAEKISNRYEWDSTFSLPIPGTTRFTPGRTGQQVDREKLLQDIDQALRSLDKRVVKAEVIEIPAKNPGSDQFIYSAKDIIQQAGFQGLVEIYAHRFSDQESVSLAVRNGNDVVPGISFTAASTMKIPIMVSTYWHADEPLDETTAGWLERMIIYSENPPADRLMERIDPVRGPLIVTEDMRKLGLENTFIAGYFYLGAPLLEVFDTPANSRADIDLDPDLYNQTTPEDIGHLLEGIYTCAEKDSGFLIDISEGAITQTECQQMINILRQNQIGALIEAGLPEETPIGHKHGWSEETDGLLHTVSDVALIDGPENDFELTIFVYSQNQLLFEEANYLIARLSQMFYNGMNINHQISWWFPEEEK